MHQNLKGSGWHAVNVQEPPGDGSKPNVEMFIGRFKDDQYHLLGFRPKAVAYLFSAASESQGDHGM